MAYGLSQTNKRARESQRESQRELESARGSQGELERDREEIWSYLDNLYTDRQTDKQTNGQTDGRTLLVPKVAIATENGQKSQVTIISIIFKKSETKK